MLDAEDLKEFLNLPPEFRYEAEMYMKIALNNFIKTRAMILKKLEEYGGEDGYKNPEAYELVKNWLGTLERDYWFDMVALNHLKKQYVKGVKNEKENEKCADSDSSCPVWRG